MTRNLNLKDSDYLIFNFKMNELNIIRKSISKFMA